MQIKIAENEIRILKGPVLFKILQGEIEAVGTIINNHSHEQFIPLGKNIPIECLKDAIIEIIKGNKNNIEILKSKTIPREWHKLIQKINNNSLKKIIVLGEMDTGKSFFITYMANKLIQLNKKVGVIDSDLGQSDIGPPGTIGFTILNQPIMFLNNANITGMEFIGSHSPGLHMVTTIVQFNKIINKCSKLCDIMLINTSGWVTGDGGRLLSRAKIDILNPDIIVLMQRKKDCEHLVKNIFPPEKVIRLTASKKASETSKGEREKLRNLSSKNYFKNAKIISLKLNNIETDKCFFKSGEQINDLEKIIRQKILFAEKYSSYEGTLIITEKKLKASEIKTIRNNGYINIKNLTPAFSDEALVGLRNKQHELLDIGIIKKINFLNNQIKIITPYNGNKNKIKIIQFGALKYKHNGTENGFFEPGSF